MGRLLVLVILVVLAVWLVRRALAGPRRGSAAAEDGNPRPGELVRCAHCGVHLPKSEAQARGELSYCTEEHARLGPREG